MIDLHTHTTASDGRCAPDELVARASAAGVRVLSVTDHDTTTGCLPAARACASAGIEFVPGIEITAVVDDTDVHVLGYFIEPDAPVLAGLLSEQRRRRIDRVRQMVQRLGELGVGLDVEAILQPAATNPRKAAGRPWIARALVDAGHVATTQEAFDRWLARGRPAFVVRRGPPPEEVVRWIQDAGGIASLAHPGLLRKDDLIPGLAGAGLDAIEVYHSEHQPEDVARYLALADHLHLAVSGGSDYHGDQVHGADRPGFVSLPRELFEKLKARVRVRLKHEPSG